MCGPLQIDLPVIFFPVVMTGGTQETYGIPQVGDQSDILIIGLHPVIVFASCWNIKWQSYTVLYVQ